MFGKSRGTPKRIELAALLACMGALGVATSAVPQAAGQPGRTMAPGWITLHTRQAVIEVHGVERGYPAGESTGGRVEQSACCTESGECLMADDEYKCIYEHGGTWYEGEVCVEDGGDFECPEITGACCTEDLECNDGLTEEQCETLYPGGTWYANETCVESGGDFTCPADSVGACCTEWGCSGPMTEEDCLTASPGATWLEGEDCDPDPCPPIQGACCFGGECITTDQETCEALVGPNAWYRGEECPDVGGEFECPLPHEESLFYQQPEVGNPDVFLSVSDTSYLTPQYLYDRFWNLDGDVCGVHWYGYPVLVTNPMPLPCEDLTGFIIRFFDLGDDLKPGTQVAVISVSIEDVQWTWREDLSTDLCPWVLAEFEVEFDECIPLHDGYVSIIGVGTGDCVFWSSTSNEVHYDSPEGDGAFCMYIPGQGLKCGRFYTRDLSIDVFGPGIAGACCDDVAGTCEVVMPEDCLSGRFEPGVTCEELDPPCGAMAGACCSETDPCYLAYEADCDGFYAGDGTTCDPTDCNDNGVGDTCDIALGYSLDCNGNGVPDECDIAGSTSDDYDADGVPDECDADRNENGVPDACDIDCTTGNCENHPLGCGGSNDCQGDGVPDDAQLGTMGDALLWDNGDPLVMHLDPWYNRVTTSQVGGRTGPSETIDDFIVADGGAVINEIVFYTETSDDFDWTGRLRLRVYANRAFWSPEGALWQADGDPNDTVVDLWIPDDGGTVTRESDGAGYLYERYKWTITDVSIPLDAGPWFIGFAPEDSGSTGLSYACFSHATLGRLVRSEAWTRPLLEEPFWALEVPEPASAWAGVDLSFKLVTHVYGEDANGNGIPDECEGACPNPGASGVYCTADISDGDCVVNLADLAVLLSNYGMTEGATHDDGDIEPSGGDGDVDLADLAALLSQYGDDCN